MKITKVNISELKAPEVNTRKHGEKQLAELKRSIEMFGQIRPLVVDEDNVVWCGNGLWQAAESMGLKSLDAYKVTGLNAIQKRKLMMADNKVFQLGFDDNEAMETVIRELDDFKIPGFDEEVLSSLYSSMEDTMEAAKAYAVLDNDTVEQMKAREETMSDVTFQKVAPPEVIQAMETAPAADLATGEEGFQEGDVKKYVVCPKCGERIWV